MNETITIVPIKNRDGTYILPLRSYHELNEIIKAIRYMETQRRSSRKHQSSMYTRSVSLTIADPINTNPINTDTIMHVTAGDNLPNRPPITLKLLSS